MAALLLKWRCDSTERVVKAWLLHFNSPLYGEELSLRHLAFVGAQRRFDSVAELVAEMRDAAATLKFPTLVYRAVSTRTER